LNIFVDFDRTLTENHSKGKPNDNDPMPHDNKSVVKKSIADWLAAGHNVIIVTRSISEQIDNYLKSQSLSIEHVMNSFTPGMLAVYAPSEAVFREVKTTADFAKIKVTYVQKFLKDSNTEAKNSFFIDDTIENVTEMKTVVNKITCEQAAAGEYKRTIGLINNWITKKTTTP
jgi:hypothetical protein